ncbi:hypothetical protein O3M35_005108 [Rhynocoris fuscipes]|uniref:Uncharacterized protein n=1 Tax=Rhynocoris fuscipes TaxID=488301 RepID=A0AAW1DGY5_9HEMI
MGVETLTATNRSIFRERSGGTVKKDNLSRCAVDGLRQIQSKIKEGTTETQTTEEMRNNVLATIKSAG